MCEYLLSEGVALEKWWREVADWEEVSVDLAGGNKENHNRTTNKEKEGRVFGDLGRTMTS